MEQHNDIKNYTFYKYRSFEDFERFLDIIVNKRLYGATYKTLNDPLEGKFNHEGLSKDDLSKIYDNLRKTRICSLLQKQPKQEFPDDFLMWSHYANSHKGCCIQLKITGRYNKEWDLFPIEYKKELPKATGNIHEQIKQILSVKTPMWENEHEWRAVRQFSGKAFATNSPYYHIKVEAVYLGMNVTAEKSKFYTRIIKDIDKDIKVYQITTDKQEVNIFYPEFTIKELFSKSESIKKK